MKRLIRPAKIWTIVLASVIFISDSAVAIGATAGPAMVFSYKRITHKDDMSRIISVLESRIEDKKLLDRARDKLSTLSKTEVGLITSLCERISEEGRTATSEIAFSVVTALIILS